ncbi:MAG: MBL fold metallo-hydrolase [Microthrixaceae bacterium]
MTTQRTRLSRLMHRNDPSVQREHIWSTAEGDLPAGLSLTWFGTAGFAVSYGGTTILIDPYVSRRSLTETVRAKSLLPDTGLVDRFVPKADAVLVGHTHFDHAVDVPAISARDGCPVYGSSSLEQLMGLHGLADRTVVVDPHEVHEVGPFTFSFTPSVHSRLLFGLKVPSGGELTCDALDSLGTGAYCCGQVWGIDIEVAGKRFYHQGSANLIDDEIRTGDVDYFLCGIAGRMYTRDYIGRIMGRLRPANVIVHHHDDFFRPLEAEMGYSFNVNLGGFIEDMDNFDSDITLRTLEPMATAVGS